MQELDSIGLTELDDAEMTRVHGGFDHPLVPIDTGGADAVIRWFVDKLTLPEVQTPTEAGPAAY
jgi:hypothetical protein